LAIEPGKKKFTHQLMTEKGSLARRPKGPVEQPMGISNLYPVGGS
jgi:hypothetical protein